MKLASAALVACSFRVVGGQTIGPTINDHWPLPDHPALTFPPSKPTCNSWFADLCPPPTVCDDSTGRIKCVDPSGETCDSNPGLCPPGYVCDNSGDGLPECVPDGVQTTIGPITHPKPPVETTNPPIQTSQLPRKEPFTPHPWKPTCDSWVVDRCPPPTVCDDSTGRIKCVDPSINPSEEACDSNRQCPPGGFCAPSFDGLRKCVFREDLPSFCVAVQCLPGYTCIPSVNGLPECVSVDPDAPFVPPSWYEQIEESFKGTRLRTCAGKMDQQPTNGSHCSRKPKTCFFNTQNCNGTPSPLTECFCSGADGEQTWNCEWLQCLQVEP